MNIKHLNKAKVLAALYNNSKALGMGRLQFDPEEMTESEAQKLLDQNEYKYFDYLKGRVMKIDLSKDDLDTRLYNRDLGEGAAEKVIATIQ
jgi:hypothetical protein